MVKIKKQESYSLVLNKDEYRILKEALKHRYKVYLEGSIPGIIVKKMIEKMEENK